MTDAAAHPTHPRQSKAKRHHYIPEMILRNFAGPDLHLWSFDKRHPNYGIERKPIARLFREWNLYTSVDSGGVRDRSTEDRLSAIESRAGPVLARIVSEARTGRVPRFSMTERRALVALLIAQMKRTPDYFEDVISRPDFRRYIADTLAIVEDVHGPGSIADYIEAGGLTLQAQRNLLARTASEPMDQTSAAMLARGFYVGVLTAPNRSFLLGSKPLIRFRGHLSGRDGIVDPTAEAWLPIAPDVALCSYGDQRDQRIVEIQDRGLRMINGAISQHSTVVASASRELVVTYTRRLDRAPQDGASPTLT